MEITIGHRFFSFHFISIFNFFLRNPTQHQTVEIYDLKMRNIISFHLFTSL